VTANRRHSITVLLIVMLIFGLTIQVQAANFSVTSIGDSGPGTLRQAILDAEASADASNIIEFDAALDAIDDAEISLLTPLPTITKDLDIRVNNRATINGPTADGNIFTITNGNVIVGNAFIQVTSDNTRVFDFTGDGTGDSLTLNFVGMNGGNNTESSGISALNVAVTLRDVTVSQMNSATGGPGITILNGSIATPSAGSGLVITDNAGLTSALTINGATTISSLNDIQMYRNTATDANHAGGLTVAIAGGSPTANIERSAFSGNTGPLGNVFINDSAYNLINVTIGQSGGANPGLTVGAGASADISFTTIASNSGVGINNLGAARLDSSIVWGNTGGSCDDAFAVTLKDVNIIEGVTCGTTATTLQTNPQLTSSPGTAAYRFRLATNSPALDRGNSVPPNGDADCADADGTVVTTDITGAVRPQPGIPHCDLGSAELTGTVIRGDATVVASKTTLEEDGVDSLTIAYTLTPIAPVPGVNVVLAVQDTSGECLVNGGAGPVNLTFTSGDFSTAQNVTVTAVTADGVEGDHTCTIDGTVTATNGAYVDGFYNMLDLDPVIIDISDGEAVDEPTIASYDLSEFTDAGTPFNTLMVEGESARFMEVDLSAPPTGTVTLNFVTDIGGGLPEQCNYPTNGATVLDGSNWENVRIPISALSDAVTEVAGAHECRFRLEIVYQYNTTTTTSPAPNQPLQTIQLGSDPAQFIEFTLQNPVTATLLEGEVADILVSTRNPLDTTEQYIVTFDIVPPDAFPGIPDQCSVTPTTATLTQADPTVDIEVRALADGIQETTANGCKVTGTVSPGSTAIIAVDEQTLTILADPVDNPTLQIDYSTGLDPVTNPPTVIEGDPLDEFVLGFSLVEGLASAPQTVTITEIGRNPQQPDPPDDPTFPDNQCFIEDNAGNQISSVTLNNGNGFSGEARIVAFDDPYAETATHDCTIEVRFNGNLETTFTVNLQDDDDPYSIFTRPDMTGAGTGLVEGTQIEIVYEVNTAPTSDLTITFSPVGTPDCQLFRNDAGSLVATAFLTVPTGQTRASLFVRAEQDGLVEGTELCQYTASLFSADADYINAADTDTSGTLTDAERDAIVPDVRVNVSDEAPNPNDDPTPTPIGTPVVTQNVPTAQPFSTEGVEILQTLTPAPSPTSLPPPYAVIAPGIERLPVRTGPYLGASLVTVGIRDININADGTTNDGQYSILGKNRDENVDVFWYYIAINGHQGWVSGRAITIELNGDGTADITPETEAAALTGEAVVTEGETAPTFPQWSSIPFRGSIFDEIDGAPDLGVFGTIIRERNIHRRPSRRAGIIGSVPVGAEVSIIGRTREITFDDWYQIRIGGTVGWIEVEQTQEQPAVETNPELIRDRVPVR
jgi:hypothetical protein